MKILLVDDSKIEQMVISSYLDPQKHQVIIASSGEEGVEAFHAERPDLILLDVMMPGIDGYEVAKRIRQSDEPWVPIIFLSGKTSSEDLAQGINAGGDDYLTKPVDPLVLSAKLQAMDRIAKMRAQLIATTTQLEQANQELKQLTLSDGLTGIANRRYLDQSLPAELNRAFREQLPISILLIDVDHFKKFNDHHGHLEGDDCLKKIAQQLKSACRRGSDFACRYGGEEFCVLLPNTDVSGAIAVADNILNSMNTVKIPHHGIQPSGHVTVSIGINADPSREPINVNDFLAHADEALYQAKHAGRNRAVVYPHHANV
ncbi:GGDEF domain-containing response regulator [Motilimonas eburnea]|uniref:GGDEF domain-containing response regulator n=1 Tax=Motilimonas eburnea TaxID=1737488 RepID=UPI001E3ACE08|nr:diguanylate cyclase [Motilimonas eburnea]MCE2570344.1 diguanylate cyclase [Motilimonas eburnea]